MAEFLTSVDCCRTLSRWYDLRQRGSRRRRQLPAEPVGEPASHHQLQVTTLEPRHLLGEHRHALTVRTGHAGNVGSPEHPVGAECVVHLAEIKGPISHGRAFPYSA